MLGKRGRNACGKLDRPLSLAILLIAAILLVYAQTWRFGFVLIDDPIEVSGNPRVQAGLTLQNLVWCFSAFFDGNWIPLTWLSLMLDTTVFGFHAGGYHFTNVLLHVANTVLLFAFLARATGNQLRSAFVAALFALHPLHVESVAWITERKDVLSTLFGLLSLLAYVRYTTAGGGWSLAACFLCFVCSLLSKQTLVTLPFVFLLLDFWPLGRLRSMPNRRPPAADLVADRVTTGPSAGDDTALRPPHAIVPLLLEKVPFLAVSAAFSVITVLAQRSGNGVRSFTALPSDDPLRERGRGLCGLSGEGRLSARPGGLLSASRGTVRLARHRRSRGPVIVHQRRGDCGVASLLLLVRWMGLVSRNLSPDDRDRASRRAADGRPLHVLSVDRAVRRDCLDGLRFSAGWCSSFAASCLPPR